MCIVELILKKTRKTNKMIQRCIQWSQRDTRTTKRCGHGHSQSAGLAVGGDGGLWTAVYRVIAGLCFCLGECGVLSAASSLTALG